MIFRSLILIPLMAANVQAAVAGPDERLAAVSYRLQTQAVALCPDATPMASFFIKNADSAVIELVVPNGPAVKAGLRAGDQITAINGNVVAATGVSELIDKALDSGTISLQIKARGLVTLKVDKGCGYPVVLEQSSVLDAYADGKAIAFSAALVGFTHDDDELALALAHELSHNILKHRLVLDTARVHRGLFAGLGKSGEVTRKTEAEADVYALYLMARAGYDINKAPAFWQRLGSRTSMGIFTDGTHLRTHARVALAEATIADIRTKLSHGEPLTPPKRLLK